MPEPDQGASTYLTALLRAALRTSRGDLRAFVLRSLGVLLVAAIAAWVLPSPTPSPVWAYLYALATLLLGLVWAAWTASFEVWRADKQTIEGLTIKMQTAQAAADRKSPTPLDLLAERLTEKRPTELEGLDGCSFLLKVAPRLGVRPAPDARTLMESALGRKLDDATAGANREYLELIWALLEDGVLERIVGANNANPQMVLSLKGRDLVTLLSMRNRRVP